MQEKSSPEFSDRLKNAMLTAGVKASALAANAGISKGYVSELLKGGKSAPSFETVRKFADVLHCSPGWLLYGVQKDQEMANMLREDPAVYGGNPPAPPPGEPAATLEDAMALMRQAMRIIEEIQRNPKP